ncbi:MAG: hypothetical protein OXE85_08590 [Roseovarius sp.]|nr:hypothetical protein [Roseovarius sp.]
MNFSTGAATRMPPGLSAERGARRPHAGLEQVPAETSGNGINQSKRREKGNVPGWKACGPIKIARMPQKVPPTIAGQLLENSG